MSPPGSFDDFSAPDAFLAMAKIGRWVLRQDFTFVWSAEMYAMFGLEPGCSREAIVAAYHPDDRNYVTRSITQVFKTGGPILTRYRIARADGTVRHVFSHSVRQSTVDGCEVVGVNIDVTDHLTIGDAAVEEARRLRFIAENARDLILRYDPQGHLTFASPASRFLLGYEPEELLGQDVNMLVDLQRHPDSRSHLMACNREGKAPGQIQVRALRKDGSGVWLEGNPRPAKNAFGEVIEWVDVLRDITDRKAAEGALRQAMAQLAHEKAAVEYGATHDLLTGLANRAHFRQRLDAMLQAQRDGGAAFVVLAIDLDHFKAVNDTLGHAAGDDLLMEFAARLRQALPADALLGRLGGDEFAATVGDLADTEAALPIARAVIAKAGAGYVLNGKPARIGVSIGIASSREGDTDTILRGADLALYRAKAQGRNAACAFESDMLAHARTRSRLEADLRSAVGSGAFELHYQPQFVLESGRVSGFEAFLRWRDGVRGIVPSADFLPVAEAIGLAVPLCDFALRQACKDAAAWPDFMRVAVNISARQFADPDLPSRVATAFDAVSLAPWRLELEISESSLIGAGAQALPRLHALKQLGVRVAIANFGSAVSVLGQLRAFAFDRLKVDRAVIRDLVGRPDAVTFLRTMTTLGDALGMTTSAEGVETPEEARYLHRAGCGEAQGFFFGPPRPAHELGGQYGFAARVESAA